MAEWNLSKTFVFGKREIRYEVLGQGPPVVMVHGTPWSSFTLRKLIEAISTEFTVYCYDLLGYGQSDKSDGDVSLGIQNQVLARLLDHWKLESPSILGHDFGGTTALRAHLINHCDFDRMVLIDPVALSPWGSPFFRHVRIHEAAFAGVPDYIHDAIVRAYVKTAAFQPLEESTLDRIVLPWTGAEGKAAFYRQIAQADSRFTDEVQPLYSRIRKPVLILWGAEDKWIPPDRGKTLHGMIPGSEFYEIPGAGHLIIEERPAALVDKILPFLRQGGMPMKR